MNKYLVQYKNASGEWVNVQAPVTDRCMAIAVFMEEARSDPEYQHRVLEITEKVIANVNAR